MVARCLPVFKVSASLIMPPPLLRRLTSVLFSSAPHTHPDSLFLTLFILGQSVTQLHFLRGLCTVLVRLKPHWQTTCHLNEVTGIQMGRWVGGTEGDTEEIMPLCKGTEDVANFSDWPFSPSSSCSFKLMFPLWCYPSSTFFPLLQRKM